jgi:uncharacterized protein YndB with AHSA1/START domain
MKTTNISHELTISAPPAQVFAALTEQRQVRRWWTPDAFLDPVTGSRARFEWRSHGWTLVVEITRLEPGRLIEWRVLDSNLHGIDEWNDMTIRFELKPKGESTTQLAFSQGPYPAEAPGLDDTRRDWDLSLGSSLKSLLEKGEGQPYRG